MTRQSLFHTHTPHDRCAPTPVRAHGIDNNPGRLHNLVDVFLVCHVDIERLYTIRDIVPLLERVEFGFGSCGDAEGEFCTVGVCDEIPRNKLAGEAYNSRSVFLTSASRLGNAMHTCCS